jgi:hypothetical protein
MAVQFVAVANSIAGLSVSGVTLIDIDEIPKTGDTRKPSFIPAPNWLSNLSQERMNFSGALRDVEYTLTYRLLYAPVGSGRGLVGPYNEMITKAGLFMDAIMAVVTLVGLEDILLDGINNVGVVLDPSDNKFWGCDISVRVLEFDDD